MLCCGSRKRKRELALEEALHSFFPKDRLRLTKQQSGLSSEVGVGVRLVPSR